MQSYSARDEVLQEIEISNEFRRFIFSETFPSDCHYSKITKEKRLSKKEILLN